MNSDFTSFQNKFSSSPPAGIKRGTVDSGQRYTNQLRISELLRHIKRI